MAGSFILVAGVENFTDTGHYPFGRSKLAVDIPAVAPFDITLDTVTIRVGNVVGGGGLQSDMSVYLRVDGTDMLLVSHVAGWLGLDIQSVSVPVAKGQTFELIYVSAGGNSSMAVPVALHFSVDAATEDNVFPVVVQNANIGSGPGEARMQPGEQSPYFKQVYTPVGLTIDRAMYHLSTPATVSQTVAVYVDEVVVGSQVLAVGEQLLDFAALGQTLAAGQSFRAGVTAAGGGDTGHPTLTFACGTIGGTSGISHPLMICESLDPSVANSFSPNHFAMPFDGIVTYAGLTSNSVNATPETVSISVNGAALVELGVVSGSPPILVENDTLSVSFSAGDVLTILNTGLGPSNGSITLTLGFAVGTPPPPPPPQDDLTLPPSPPGRSTVGPAPIGSYPVGGPFVFDEVVVYDEAVVDGATVRSNDSLALFYRIVASEPAPLGECLTVYPDSSSTMVVPADDCIVGGA